MKNIILLSATTLLWAIPSYSMQTEPEVPQGIVTVVHSEVEIEYLPEVTVTIAHDEVEIQSVPEG